MRNVCGRRAFRAEARRFKISDAYTLQSERLRHLLFPYDVVIQYNLAQPRLAQRTGLQQTLTHSGRENQMTRKEIAETFLKLASSGKVREAFAWHVHSKFRHHNAYFKADRESLMRGMERSAKDSPDKSFHTLRAVEEGDLVAIHGRVVFSPELQWSVIHIFRFEGNLIIEEWEASQEAFPDSPNENGIF